MKKFLFPTDYSENSEHAFIYALKFAEKHEAELINLHVYDRPDIRGVALPNTLKEIYDQINIEEFEEFKSELPKLKEMAEAHQLSHIPIKHILVENRRASDGILRTAKSENVDLIIMGTKGHSKIVELLVGSTTNRVMELAPCPVLSVPVQTEFDLVIDQIGFATRFIPEEIKLFKRALELSETFDANLHCFTADTVNERYYQEQIEKWKAQNTSSVNVQYHILKEDDLLRASNRFITQYHLDLIVLISRQRNFLDELFNYSYAKELAHRSKAAVYAVPEALIQ